MRRGPEPLNVFFWESPSLALCRLGCSCNVPSRGTGNRGRRLDRLSLGVSFGAGLVAIGDAMNRERLQARSRVSLVVKGILNRCSGLIVARVGRVVIEAHVAEALVDSAVHALSSSGYNTGVKTLAQRGAAGDGFERCRSVVSSLVDHAGRRRRNHGRDAHVAGRG